MTTLVLGPVIFKDLEIPEGLRFGGKQMLAVHKLIGGYRVVDAMGPDEHPRSWSGRFQGSDASERAQLLDALRIQGAQLPLSFGSFFATVVIADLKLNFERWYQVLYSIEVVVVTSDPSAVSVAPSLDDLVGADLAQAASAAAIVASAAVDAVTALASTFDPGGFAA